MDQMNAREVRLLVERGLFYRVWHRRTIPASPLDVGRGTLELPDDRCGLEDTPPHSDTHSTTPIYTPKTFVHSTSDLREHDETIRHAHFRRCIPLQSTPDLRRHHDLAVPSTILRELRLCVSQSSSRLLSFSSAT